MNRFSSRTLFALFIASVSLAQTPTLSPQALQQARELRQWKAGLSANQKKIGVQLLAAAKLARGEGLTASIPSLQGITDTVGTDRLSGQTVIDIRTSNISSVASAIAAAGGRVLYSSTRFGAVRASLPLGAVESLGARADVSKIRIAAKAATHRQTWDQMATRIKAMENQPSFTSRRARIEENLSKAMQLYRSQHDYYQPTYEIASLSLPRLLGLAPVINTGLVASQGIISHRARQVANNLGITGSGVKIGVLSDSAEYLQALIGTGDLPPGSTTIPGGEPDEPHSSEGSAMMEIVYDMAPGAQILFASAFNGDTAFADNIRALAAAGCQIIVDDVFYFNESPYQDGIIARAVNDVTAAGVIYFSSAGNEGNTTAGTSGTWEGDYTPFPTTTYARIGTNPFDVQTAPGAAVTLQWSDALGASANDYDLLIFNSTGTTLIDFSADPQDGTQDPYEAVNPPPAGSLIVVDLFAGAPRALTVATLGGLLQVRTSGATKGHGASEQAVGVAAVNWNSARRGTTPFTGGAANPNEPFSSDGPRRIFYNPDGTAITPGNYLFGTNGGRVLQKPDIAAADGVTCATPGFSPFFGTSAAAPHAAAIAALVKSKKPSLTRTDIINIMKATALDNMAPGIDKDSGKGIVMAYQAVTSVP